MIIPWKAEDTGNSSNFDFQRHQEKPFQVYSKKVLLNYLDVWIPREESYTQEHILEILTRLRVYKARRQNILWDSDDNLTATVEGRLVTQQVLTKDKLRQKGDCSPMCVRLKTICVSLSAYNPSIKNKNTYRNKSVQPKSVYVFKLSLQPCKIIHILEKFSSARGNRPKGNKTLNFIGLFLIVTLALP